MNRRHYALIGLAAAAALTLSACSNDPMASGGGGSSDEGTIAVGSAAFPENELLAEMYSQALEGAGFSVTRNFNIGARDIYLAAIEDGSIDLLPEYNGALYSSLIEGGAPEGVTTADAVNAELQKVLPEGLETLPMSEAEDKDTLVVTPETAEKYGLTSIADLEPVAGEFAIGSGAGWDETYVGLVGLKDKYNLDFKEFRGLDTGGPLTLAALLDGTIQVANLFSTDANIERQGLVILDDPEHLFLAENITPLIRSDKATDKAKEAINAVSEALTTENLTEALSKVTIDKQETATVADEFLTEHDIDH
ncbi:ABC transporter substrate-binding protein [Microbacteriaceae bacterium VKM Ac-2855]|nr:ABC transporter substrate-binding protein [Microbacteriaceae bacterium VKM Ac-2855]